MGEGGAARKLATSAGGPIGESIENVSGAVAAGDISRCSLIEERRLHTPWDEGASPSAASDLAGESFRIVAQSRRALPL